MTNNAVTPLLAPFSQEAEEAVIGAVMISPNMYGVCAKFLTAEDFYLTRHREIWTTFKRLYEEEAVFDLTTVSEDLRVRGKLDEIGGYTYLIQLVSNTPNSMHAETYAELVQRTAMRRKLLTAADQLRELAMNEALRYGEVFARAQAALDMARPHDRTRHLQGAVSIQVYSELIQQRDMARERGEALIMALPEQWHTVREKLGALQWGDVVVVGGPSGSGKSAFLECLAEWFASQGNLVSYTHTEMSHNNLLDRRHARHSGLPYHVLLQGAVTDGVPFEKFLDGENFIATFADNISYDWMPNVSMADLATHWRIQYEAGYRAFFLDHFQDVTFSDKERADMLGARERLAAWIAAFVEKRGDVLVIVASQLNNEGEVKGGKKLFEKATLVLTINRPTLSNPYSYRYRDDAEVQYNPGEDSPVADIQVTKNRFGTKPKFKMFYHGLRFGWYDLKELRSTGLPITTTTKVTPFPPKKPAQEAK